jgi:hypothetical protein
MRDVPFQTEPLTFSCADLAALLDNLRSNGQAAFRLTANTLLDDSLYAYESGFGRRASGLEMGPKLVLYRGAGDPLDQAAGGTPVIANVRAERTGADDAVVYWDTSIPSNSLVLFRTTGTSDALIQVGSPAYTVHHEVGLTNLGGKPLEFAVRSATASGAAATDTGGAGHAFQLPLDLVAKPPLPPLAATAASHGGYDEATETQPSSVNQSHGDGLVCRAPVRGSTPGTPGAGGRGGGGGTKTKPGGGRQRAPKLSSLRVRPRVFRPLRSGGPISRARRGGTIVSYRDSAPATTTFVVLRRLPGVVRDRACVDPRLVRGSHAKLRRCARLIAAGSFSRRDRAGVNSFRFSGRLGRVALAAGTYILRATAALSGLQSAAVSTPFVVLRSRRNAAPRRSRCRDPDRDRDCDAVGQV